MVVIVPSFSCAGSAEQPQSTTRQRQTQDGNVEHPAEPWPHQVEEIHLQGVGGTPRAVHATRAAAGASAALGF